MTANPNSIPTAAHETAEAKPLAALTLGERLVVLGLRRWITGWQRNESWHWSLVWNDYAKALGKEPAQRALGGLNGIVREFAISIRRPYRYAPCCCGLLCSDEMTVLCLVAACQRSDRACSARLAEWLVQPKGKDGLIEAAAELAAAFDAAGHGLPDRQREPAAPLHGSAPAPASAPALSVGT